MKIFQQGHWVEKNHIWFNTYDISTPEKANTIGLAAFKLYLNRYYKDGKYPDKEYTLEKHKEIYKWRGGENRDYSVPVNRRAWEHFDKEKIKEEEFAKKFHVALDHYRSGTGEPLIEFLDKFEDEDLTFQVISVREKFVAPDSDEDYICRNCSESYCSCGKEDFPS